MVKRFGEQKPSIEFYQDAQAIIYTGIMTRKLSNYTGMTRIQSAQLGSADNQSDSRILLYM